MTNTNTTVIEFPNDTIDTAILEFEEGLSGFGYSAEMLELPEGRVIRAYLDGYEIAQFAEGEGDWIGKLQDLAYSISGGAMAA